MAEAKLQYDCNSCIFWRNLLALGFEPEVAERMHRIEFKKDMFQKPNHKGFGVVMHFLFLKLNPQQAKDKFRDCYPILDIKQEQVFRKTCRDWLQNIVQKYGLSTLQQGLAFVLQSKGGRKFYKFLKDFSALVLYENVKMEIESESLCTFSLNSKTSEVSWIPSYEVYDLATTCQMKSMFETCHKLQNYWKELENYGQNLTREYRCCLQQITLHQKCLLSVTEELGISTTTEAIEANSCEELNSVTEYVCMKKDEVESKWTFCEDEFQKEMIAWKIFDDVLFKERHLTILRKEPLAICLPGGLFANCDVQLEKNRKLSLVGLFAAWNFLLNQLSQGGKLGSLQRLAEDQLKISQVQMQVESLQLLKSRLDGDLMPSMESLIKSLRERLLKTGLPQPSVLELGRELVCPTPPLTKFHFDTLEDTPSPFLSLRSLGASQSATTCGYTQNKRRVHPSRNRLIATDRRQVQRVLTEEQSFVGGINFPEHEFGCGDAKKCESPMLFTKRISFHNSCDDVEALLDVKNQGNNANKRASSPGTELGKKFNVTEELGLHILDTPVRSVTPVCQPGAFSSPSKLLKPSLHESWSITPQTSLRLVFPDTLRSPTPPLPPRLQKVILEHSRMGSVPTDSDPEPLDTLQISLVESTPPSPTPPNPPRLWKFLQAQTDKVDDI